MKYFKECKTEIEVKARFKKLALEFHPDRTGYDTNEKMAEINAEYKKALVFVMKNQGKTDTQIDEELNLSDDYIKIINSIIYLDGLVIELVGNWIWVTGETKIHKDILRENALRWASKKLAWYWSPPEYKCSSKGKKDLETIKNKYGSKKIAETKGKKLISKNI